MTNVDRRVYVISDLHIGGEWPDEPGGRGFRMCTRIDALTELVRRISKEDGAVELVINGDFVDFLAEPDDDGGWQPYIADPARATATLWRIIERDRPFFDALGGLLARGHRLTVLLGNHDIELSLPATRRALRAALGVEDSGRFGFLFDGEAYLVGDALIEHGNRYDGFNAIDHDALRRVRSLQSRGQSVDVDFEPPPGSRLVASIMNPIKRDYAFVDLLKPETAAVLPILLALEPDYRQHARRIAKLAYEAKRADPVRPGRPRFDQNVSARRGTLAPDAFDDVAASPPDPLERALDEVLGVEGRRRFLAALDGDEVQRFDTDVSAGRTWLGLARLAVRPDPRLERRLCALLDALRAVRFDRSFEFGVETAPAYLEAAEALTRSPHIRHVLFGHTHLAKQVRLSGGGWYLNTGTWADLMCVPDAVLHAPDDEALKHLRRFVDGLRAGHLDEWIAFRPTYARLDLVDGRVIESSVLFFQ